MTKKTHVPLNGKSYVPPVTTDFRDMFDPTNAGGHARDAMLTPVSQQYDAKTARSQFGGIPCDDTKEAPILSPEEELEYGVSSVAINADDGIPLLVDVVEEGAQSVTRDTPMASCINPNPFAL